MSDLGDAAILLLVIAARLLVPLAIPRYPIPASLAALLIDGVDNGVLTATTDLDLADYQRYDKALDIYYLAIQYLTALRNWDNLGAVAMARLLFYYRLVGSLLFELTQARALLLFFPNAFEYFFLFYEAVRARWDPRRLGPAGVIAAAFAIWVLIKVPQEYWIHIAQLDATDAIKEHVFGAPPDAPWGEILAANLPRAVAILAALAGLVVAVRRFVGPRLPAPDHPPVFRADVPADLAAGYAAARREDARRLFDAALLEKLAFVGLIATIFSQLLPGATVTPGQAALGAAVVIVANAAASEWLLRAGAGVVWRSAAAEFAAMALVNAVLAAAIVALANALGRRLDPAATGFALLLVTLLVTLFDRFRPYHAARLRRTGG